MGADGEAAAAAIGLACPQLSAEVCPAGTMITMDYREDRVRVHLTPEGMVAYEPALG